MHSMVSVRREAAPLRLAALLGEMKRAIQEIEAVSAEMADGGVWPRHAKAETAPSSLKSHGCISICSGDNQAVLNSSIGNISADNSYPLILTARHH